MKLRALRLSEVGCFTRPVALEGLSGGLDVLAGPNELGKSTLFNALRAVLYEKFDSQKKEVKALRSERGGTAIGSPLIEVEFEVDGRNWRVRKQFLSGKTAQNAELADVASGDVLARGGEVDEQLRHLLGMDEKGQDRLGLLWVGQTEALRDVVLAATQSGQIEGLIADEIEQVADGGSARTVLAMVQAQLSGMETSRGAKAKSDYANALAHRRETVEALEVTRQRADQAADRLERLAELRLELDRLANPVAAERLRSEIQQAEEKHARAREIVDGFTAAGERLAHARIAHRQAEGELRQFERAQSEIATLEKELHQAAGMITGFQENAAKLAAKRKQLRQQAGQAATRRSMLESAGGAAQARSRLADLDERMKAVRAAGANLRRLDQGLVADKNLPGMLAQAENELRGVELLRARMSAATPRLRVHYLAGVEGRMRVGGAPIADAEEILISTPTVIEIEGLGRIEIAPGGDDGREKMIVELSAGEARLAGLLSGIGSDDITTARARAEDYRASENEARRLRDELRLLAPDGPAPIVAGIAQCEAVIAGTIELPAEIAGFSSDQIAAEIMDLDRARKTTESASEEAEQAHAEAASELARMEATGAAATARLSALHQAMEQIGDPSRHAEGLRSDEVEAREKLQIAQLDLDARERSRPSDGELERFGHDLSSARQRHDRAVQRINEVEKQIERLDGELQRDREEGLGEKVLELEGVLSQAERAIARFEREIAGLKRLQSALLQARQDTRDRFLKPVEERMLPYLQMLFPEARLRLGAAFGVDDLVRGDQHDAFERLSIGTREQLAVLVRLGFARLLAEKGRPAPVVLDDALVYSDDDRIARMFQALEAASVRHQVIVLTCRTRAFEPLGGHRLELRPSNFAGARASG